MNFGRSEKKIGLHTKALSLHYYGFFEPPVQTTTQRQTYIHACKDGIAKIYTHFVLFMCEFQVAGCQISILCRKGEKDRIPEMECPQMKQILPFLELLDAAGPVFDHYPELDCYAELFMISMEKEFRGYGLATKSYQLVADMVKARGVKLLKSSFTNPYSQRIATKLGYREIGRVYNRDYKDSNGDLVWPHVEDDYPDYYGIVGVLELETE